MTAAPDPLVLGSQTDSNRDRYRFHTADGVPDADAFCPGELLALEHLWDSDLGRLRTVDARYGVVGIVLAERASAVELTTPSARAAALCERNRAQNDVDATVSTATGLGSVDRTASERPRTDYSGPVERGRADGRTVGAVDTTVFVPKGYDPIELGNRRVRTALRSLAPDGDLFVAATPETGLSRFESTLNDAADTVRTVGTNDDWALLRASGPKRDRSPSGPPFDWLRERVDGVDLSLVTAPGLFAPTAVDDGTRLLAATADIADGDRVLDLCCGYGTLGAHAGSTADCELWCSDDDRLATACACRSLDANGVDGRVVTADCTDGVDDRTFDTVLCNPPTHAGDGVLADIFRGVANVLAPDGRFWFVHHRALDLSRHVDRFDRIRSVATGPEHVVQSATAEMR